jgi:hypothetical protein
MTDPISKAIAALVDTSKVLAESCAANAISVSLVVMLDKAGLIPAADTLKVLNEFSEVSPNAATSALIETFVQTIHTYATSEVRPNLRVIVGGLSDEPLG